MESLGTQLYAFGIVLLAGVSLGLLFDFFRVLRGLLQPGCLSTPLLDLLFWALVTPVLILYLLLANWGELRAYVLIALFLGFSFYRLLLSPIVLMFLLWLVRVVGHVLNFFCTLGLWLFSVPVQIVQEIRFNWSKGRSKTFSDRPSFVFRPKLRWRTWWK